MGAGALMGVASVSWGVGWALENMSQERSLNLDSLPVLWLCECISASAMLW